MKLIASLLDATIARGPIGHTSEQVCKRRAANRSIPSSHLGRVRSLRHVPMRCGKRGAADDRDVASYRTGDFVV